jgi:hypothetical protein
MPVPQASETQSVIPPPPQYLNVPPPPVQYVPVAAVTQKRKRRIWPFLLVSFLLIVTVIVVIGVILVRKAAVAAENFKEEIKKEIPVPDTTTPTPDALKTSLGDLYYPGSIPQPGMLQGGSRLVHLQTSDPIDKVVAYYKSKLPNITPLSQDSDSFAFMFQKDQKMNVITGKLDNGTTNIFLAVGIVDPSVTVPGYPKSSKRR